MTSGDLYRFHKSDRKRQIPDGFTHVEFKK